MRYAVGISLALLALTSTGCQLAWKDVAQERAPRRVHVDGSDPPPGLVDQVKTGQAPAQVESPARQTISDHETAQRGAGHPVYQPTDQPPAPLAGPMAPTHQQVSYAATIAPTPSKPRSFYPKSPHVQLKGMTQSGNGDSVALLQVGERTVLARKGHRFTLHEDGESLELVVEEISADVTVLLDPKTDRRWEAQ